MKYNDLRYPNGKTFREILSGIIPNDVIGLMEEWTFYKSNMTGGIACRASKQGLLTEDQAAEAGYALCTAIF
jgi:hypothetical protein